MTETPRMSGETFATERLRNNPQLTFEALRQAAEQEGVAIQPIQYGRARRQLGLTGTPPTTAPQPDAIEASVGEIATPEPTTAPIAAKTELAAQAATLSTPKPTSKPNTKKSKPGFEFLVESLRADGTLSYGDLRAQAEQRGLQIAPIMYGRAKALLGLVPVRPRGQGKNRTAAARAKAANTLGSTTPTPPDKFSKQLERVRNVEDLVKIVKHLDGERRRLRGLLERIANSIDESLDHTEAQS